MEVILWLVLAAVFAATEFATVSLVSIWFVGGALAALTAALLGAALGWQIGLFVAVSALLLVALRPFLQRYIRPKIVKTNVDALVGEKAVVIDAIDNLAAEGTVKLNGALWTARSMDEQPIPAGTVVRVEAVEGVKVLVRKA